MSAGDWKDMIKAVQTGDLELVRYHISNGVDPNYQHPEFLTSALIESIENHQPEITRYLLNSGADPQLKAIFGNESPLQVAKRVKNADAIQLLEPYYPSVIQRLLRRGEPKK